jgi:hypothetical protein
LRPRLDPPAAVLQQSLDLVGCIGCAIDARPAFPTGLE